MQSPRFALRKRKAPKANWQRHCKKHRSRIAKNKTVTELSKDIANELTKTFAKYTPNRCRKRPNWDQNRCRNQPKQESKLTKSPKIAKGATETFPEASGALSPDAPGYLFGPLSSLSTINPILFVFGDAKKSEKISLAKFYNF